LNKLRLFLVPVALLLFLSVGGLPIAAAQTVTQVSAGNIELSIYLVIIGVLIAFAVMTLKLWGGLGMVGGLIGAIFAYYCLTSQNLITNTLYDQTAQTWVYTTMPIGFFAYVPLLLCALNLILVVKKK